jgi:asparagine synthase (glutamine-hydrolysing)
MFGGYNVYKEPLALEAYQKLPLFLRKGAASLAKALPRLKGKNFLIRGSLPIEERYIGNSNIFPYEERDLFMAKKYDSKRPQYYTKPFYNKVKKLDDITKMQYMDMHVWMVQEILLKADKMSMAHSLELRVPFLDKEIFKLARTIPTKYKVSRENTKLALRQAARSCMNEISANRRKMAFPLPLPDWLREDLYYVTVKEAFNGNVGKEFFNQERINVLLEEHKSGKFNHARRIWAIYTFILWYQVFFQDRKVI